MPDVKRTVVIATEQNINPNKNSQMEGYPMRDWHIEIFLRHEVTGELVPANCYERVTYNLHESFGKRAKQTFKQAPFRIAEEGWGEFDIRIQLASVQKGIDHDLLHDLNFLENKYEAKHNVVFKNPKPELLAILQQSGSVPDANGLSKDSAKKKGRKDKNVDMEKLADALQKLGEDDLLQVVQMVHDNKTSDTYTLNDIDNGEFHVDLYTLPDSLVKMLWDFAASKTDL